MPLIDNYLLDNYYVDGGSSSKYKVRSLASFNGGVSIPPGEFNYAAYKPNNSDIEVGTNLIVIGAAGSTSAQLTASSGNPAVCHWGLIDRDENPWILQTLGSTNASISIHNVVVDLVLGLSYTLESTGSTTISGSTVAVRMNVRSKPSGFKIDGPLKFVGLGTNSSSNTANALFVVSNIQLITS
ncbi:hypothetical protein ACIOBL_19525 [Paenibacillus taichungensis]|uniref:hypothetical protein n=1 Tax=Paenibacillus taichungensis TaxID=484184 RepID=UPI0038045A4E